MPNDDNLDDESKAILHRLDERTERIDGQIERMSERTNRIESRVTSVEKENDGIKSDIRRNTTILNAMTFGIGGAVTAFWAWLQGLIHI